MAAEPFFFFFFCVEILWQLKYTDFQHAWKHGHGKDESPLRAGIIQTAPTSVSSTHWAWGTAKPLKWGDRSLYSNFAVVCKAKEVWESCACNSCMSGCHSYISYTVLPVVCTHPKDTRVTGGTALHWSPLLGRLSWLGNVHTCRADLFWVVLWFNMVRVKVMFPSVKCDPALPPRMRSPTKPEEQAELVGYMYISLWAKLYLQLHLSKTPNLLRSLIAATEERWTALDLFTHFRVPRAIS